MPFVYILLSNKDGKKYIGSTINLVNRLNQHNSGQVKSTKYRRLLELAAYKETKSIKEAAILERKYKKSSGALQRAVKNNGLIILRGIV